MNTRILKSKFRQRGRIVFREQTAVYHVICRTALQSFLFDAEAKSIFRAMLFKQARFTGINVLSYCLMDNHFHLLLKVPPCPLDENGAHRLSDDELLKRYTSYYGTGKIPLSTYSVAELRTALATGGEEAEEARRSVLARMGDLSAFMRELKQRFVIWYHSKNGTVGTLWSARFKSIVVENSATVLPRVAAYIDLNPVRAGIVSDPADYQWSGYSAGRKGSAEEKSGLCLLFPGDTSPCDEIARSYKLILYGIGLSRGKRKIDATHDDENGSATGGPAVPLLKRLDQLTQAVAIGSAGFVESLRPGADDANKLRRRRSHPVAEEGVADSVLFSSRRSSS